MIELVTGGGLGDAAMSFAKAHARYSDNIDDIKITHVSEHYGVDNRLGVQIKDFYSSQNIESEVLIIENWDWVPKNRNKFEAYLGTNWTAENHGDETSWEINPFPKIQFNKVDGYPYLLSPISGGWSNKFLDSSEVEWFCNKTGTALIGNDAKPYSAQKSFYNQTTMKEIVDLIASSEVVISPEGFIAYFAGMCGKKVYCFDMNIEAIRKRCHPKWDLKIINSLEEVLL